MSKDIWYSIFEYTEIKDYGESRLICKAADKAINQICRNLITAKTPYQIFMETKVCALNGHPPAPIIYCRNCKFRACYECSGDIEMCKTCDNYLCSICTEEFNENTWCCKCDNPLIEICPDCLVDCKKCEQKHHEHRHPCETCKELLCVGCTWLCDGCRKVTCDDCTIIVEEGNHVYYLCEPCQLKK